MPKKKLIVTQTDAKNAFEETLKSFIDELNFIDNKTPWSELEPKWWLAMAELRAQCYKTKKEIFDEA